ncbi:Ku protein [Benzoatithermus flavus]|uniref:Non-homologous end joining protein Ku n=1 Tax=Benzoatithermus flavus TaxID=3108223 RepID=A0ABU8XMG4_9PROT
MAPRAYWKGYLRLSLVTFPVQLYPAIDTSRDIHLHQIHKPTGERVRYEKVVPGKGPVENDAIVMGYEVDEGRHVLLEDEELKAVAPLASDTIELEQFIDARELDDIYVDTPYFLLPADKIGGDAYAVLRTALKETGRIGIGEVVLHRRERVVAVRPCGHGLMLQTLRYAEDLRAADQYFGTLDTTPPDPRMVELTKALIEQKSAPFEPGRFKDDYEAALRALIQSKLEGRKPRRKAPQRPPAEIIDLMQALKRSLDDLQESANANEAAAPKPARGHGRRTA